MSVGIFCRFDGGLIAASDGFEYNPSSWEKRASATKYAAFQKPFGHGVVICTGNPELSKKLIAAVPQQLNELTLAELAKGAADLLRREAQKNAGYPRQAEKLLEQTPALIVGYDRTIEKFGAYQVTNGFQTSLEGTDFFSIGIGAQYAFSGRIRQKLAGMELALESTLLAYANSLKIRGVEGYARIQVIGVTDVTTLDAPACTFLGNLAVLDLLLGTKLLKEDAAVMPSTEKQVSPAAHEKLSALKIDPSLLFRTQLGFNNWQELLGKA